MSTSVVKSSSFFVHLYKYFFWVYISAKNICVGIARSVTGLLGGYAEII